MVLRSIIIQPENISCIIENGNRHTVLEAFHSFIDHAETASWLNGFAGRSDHDIDAVIAGAIT
ncbi:MAG: hypothetical protein WBG90_02090 [Saonia sp.]